MQVKYVIAGIAVLVVSGTIWLWFGRAHEVTNFPQSGTTIVAFGDSLVEGVGTSPGRTFVDVLSARVGEEILNLGISGNTTSDGLVRLDEVLVEDPRIVIVLLGGNDALRSVDPDVTFGNLRAIIEELQREGVAVLLVGAPGGIRHPKTYEREFKKLAEDYGTAYVPNILKGLLGRPQYMADAIHPNDAGHVIMADRIEPGLRLLLQRE